MQKRAGLLFLAKNTGRVLLILDDQLWTVPTFSRNKSLIEDALPLIENYSQGKLLPIELYLSEDRGFEYSTYVCLVDNEFCPTSTSTIAWCSLNYLPKHLHKGLNLTLNNRLIKAKIETILEILNDT